MTHEKTMLGQIIMDNSIFHSLEINEDDFYIIDNKRIFRAIEKCIDSGLKADLVTIMDHDNNINPAALSELTSNTASAANWKYYHSALIKKSYKLKVGNLSRNFIDWVNNLSPEKAINNLEDAITDINKNNSKNKIVKIKDIGIDFVNLIEERYNHKGEPIGIQSGIENLDKMIIGFRERLFYIIGGRPSQGKSALLLNLACHAGIKLNKKVGYISTESSVMEIITRLFSSEGNINSMNLITGMINPIDFTNLITVADRVSEKNMYFYYTPGMTLDNLSQIARLMVKFYGCEIIYVDYLQDIFIPGNDNNIEKTSRKSKQLKKLAEELNIPIVAAAQLRRDAEERRPRLSDFSDSSQIEKDADGAILIYHHHVNKKKPEETPVYESYLLAEKTRDGMTGSIPVSFVKQYVKFRPRILDE